MLALYGPDVADSTFAKFGYAVMLGMNGSIAYYDTSDSIPYSWFAFVFVVFCVGCRMSALKKAGTIMLYWEYHVNLTDIVAGFVVMASAYTSKGYGDGGDHYTIGHGIWQTLSLGPGLSLWANSSSMHYSLWFWKRKRDDGKYYCEVVDPTGYDVNLLHSEDHASDTESDAGTALIDRTEDSMNAKMDSIRSAVQSGDSIATLNAIIDAVKGLLDPGIVAKIERIQEKLASNGKSATIEGGDMNLRRMPTINRSLNRMRPLVDSENNTSKT